MGVYRRRAIAKYPSLEMAVGALPLVNGVHTGSVAEEFKGGAASWWRKSSDTTNAGNLVHVVQSIRSLESNKGISSKSKTPNVLYP